MAGKRRGSGEGTVRRRRDGIYEARLLIPKELRQRVGGKTYLYFYARTQREVLDKRKEASASLLAEGPQSVAFDAKTITVGQWLERWLSGPLRRSVSENTYQGYAYRARKYLIPAIGGVKLADLTAEHLDLLYEGLCGDGLSPTTVGHIHAVIRVALSRAVKKRIVPYNVARDAEPPKKEKRRYVTLSRSQLEQFFAAAAGDRFEAAFIMGALTGLRPGELLGLKWEDLRLPEEAGAAGEAAIRRSYSATGSGAYMRETTKTGSGRLVYLLPEVVAALKAHRKRQLEEKMAYRELWSENGLVFPSRNGTPYSHQNLNRRHFKVILEAAGLPPIRPYDLRHTFATLWLESGEHAKILQEVLGHSRISLTLDTYSHVVPHMQREAMWRFGGRLYGGGSGSDRGSGESS